MTMRAHTEVADAVSAAKELFWRRGYNETSMEEVVSATGLNRYALYNTFGGKLELFLSVLELYKNERKELFLRVLNDPERSPLDAIRSVSDFCISEMAERSAGCLMCNVALELGHYEPVVAERINEYLQEIQSAKEMALNQAAERGELNPAISPKEGASMLMTHMLGIGALARNNASRDDMLRSLNTCLATLGAAVKEKVSP